MDPQATPRRRQLVAEDPATPTTSRKRKAAYAPDSLPTPSSTRRRTVRKPVDSPARALPLPELAESSTKPRVLPAHLQTVLSLHRAFNMVLSLHIATHPPVLPPHSASTTLLRVPNLTNIVAMRDAVERASSRRFGSQELARLAWLWAWDGESLPSEAKEDDNPFIERKAAPAPEVAGLSYTVTTTRTLCPKSGERVHTYGIGIELELQPGETRQVLMGGAEGGLGNRGVGGGVRLISRWTAGGELRESTIRKRLERWVELNGGLLEEPKEESYLPTPSTRDSDRSEIPPIPLLPLPKIPSMLNSSPAAQRLFAASPSAAASSSSSSLSLPPAFATATPKKTTIAGLSDPFEFVEKTPKAAPSTPKASLEERRRAMEERIKSRSQSAKANRISLASAVHGSPGVIHRPTAQLQEELRRRSTLSRLEPIAEGVWMMFLPRRGRKAIPLLEVAEMIVKSSKTPISDAEAQASLKMLVEMCPFFLTSKVVGKQEWLEMPTAAIPVAPESPGPAVAAAAVTDSPGTPRARPRALSVQGSPRSPGRVRTGLEEVRKRIRQELGEW